MDSFAKTLYEDGVVVVKVLNDVKEWNELFWKISDDFQEYKVKGKDVKRVLGGFGAYGNPSSFHHTEIRKMRKFIHDNFSVPFFKAYEEYRLTRETNSQKRHLEILFDRMCQRRLAFGKPQAESWHRDISPDISASDSIFGGWINLSNEDQKFSCVPKTQFDPVDETGFVPQAKQKGTTYKVPKGHIVVFFQNILHRVSSSGVKDKPSIRLFFGHRLTLSDQPLFENKEYHINTQAVPQLPSGQYPPMYSSNHITFFLNKMFTPWVNEVFREELLTDIVVKGKNYKSPISTNDPELRNARCMDSLTYYEGLPNSTVKKYEDYNPEDVRIMLPHLL